MHLVHKTKLPEKYPVVSEKHLILIILISTQNSDKDEHAVTDFDIEVNIFLFENPVFNKIPFLGQHFLFK